jgi:hypothetical protein
MPELRVIIATVLSTVVPLAVVGGAVWLLRERGLDIWVGVLREARSVAQGEFTRGSLNFLGLMAILVVIILCLAIKELHSLLSIALFREQDRIDGVYLIIISSVSITTLGLVTVLSVKYCNVSVRRPPGGR